MDPVIACSVSLESNYRNIKGQNDSEKKFLNIEKKKPKMNGSQRKAKVN